MIPLCVNITHCSVTVEGPTIMLPLCAKVAPARTISSSSGDSVEEVRDMRVRIVGLAVEACAEVHRRLRGEDTVSGSGSDAVIDSFWTLEMWALPPFLQFE